MTHCIHGFSKVVTAEETVVAVQVCVTNCHLVVVSISASHVCTCPTASFTMLADILTTCHLLARCATQNSAVSLRFIDPKGALPVHPHLHRQNLMLWFSSKLEAWTETVYYSSSS